MSTRATYTFVLPYGGNVTMYIHHDGYPEGAARYLLAAHCATSKGSLADRFHRANERAELMGRDEPGDIQYAYAVHDDGTLSARKRDTGGHPWMPFFAGHYAEFINRYASADTMPEGKIKLVKTSRWLDHREWCTRGQLERRHAAAIEALEQYRERFPTHTGNIATAEGEVAALALALVQYDGGEGIE